MFPTFLVIGAAKCGTTSFCHLLGQHPMVFMCNPKEPHFFGRKGPEKTDAWYESLFAGVTSESAVGEGSTSYTHPEIIDKAAAEIRQQIPDCRLIYLVRDPLKRLESDWRMRKHEGWAAGPINQCVQQQQNLILHGLYWKNLNVYRALFPEEQILVIFFEDLIAEPAEQLRKSCEHIGVDPDFTWKDIDKPQNASKNLRKDGRIASLLRHASRIDQIKANLPPWLIGMAKSVLTRKEDLSFEWDEAVRASVRRQFHEDSVRLLTHFDKPADFWG